MRIARILAAASLLLAAGAAQAQEGPPATISVQGSGTVSAAPDLAEIQIGVVSTAETAGAAMRANSALVAKVIEDMKARGIADKDMQTVEVSINPQYPDRRTNEGSHEIVGYTVQNRLAVTVRELERLGAVLDGLVAAGANTVSGIRFDVSERRKLADEALATAVKDARARAEMIAGAAGVTLGPVREISQGGGGSPQPFFARAAAESVPIAPGSLTISADVNAVFAIDR